MITGNHFLETNGVRTSQKIYETKINLKGSKSAWCIIWGLRLVVFCPVSVVRVRRRLAFVNVSQQTQHSACRQHEASPDIRLPPAPRLPWHLPRLVRRETPGSYSDIIWITAIECNSSTISEPLYNFGILGVFTLGYFKAWLHGIVEVFFSSASVWISACTVEKKRENDGKLPISEELAAIRLFHLAKLPLKKPWFHPWLSLSARAEKRQMNLLFI